MASSQLTHVDQCLVAALSAMNSSDYGDEKDRVLVKSDGNYTYLTPDIAYHIDKINRGYEELIDVLGSDHHGYINRLKSALQILGYKSDILDIKILQMVRLIKDGEEFKMSKRTGKSVTLDMASAVSGTKYRGEFEERMKKIIKELEENDDIILFIDEIHTLVGAGGANYQSLQMTSKMKRNVQKIFWGNFKNILRLIIRKG